MKFTKLPKATLVDIIAARIADSIIDDSANDLREFIMDLESGRVKPICTWTRRELVADLMDDAECFGCDVALTGTTAFVTDDDSRDLVCKACHDASK